MKKYKVWEYTTTQLIFEIEADSLADAIEIVQGESITGDAISEDILATGYHGEEIDQKQNS